MKTTNHKPRVSGTKVIGIQLPEALHETMKALCAARHRTEGSDPRICRLYKEAVEQFIAGIDPETGLPWQRLSGPDRRNWKTVPRDGLT